MTNSFTLVIASDSEAIQRLNLDCFVACASRNDEGITRLVLAADDETYKTACRVYSGEPSERHVVSRRHFRFAAKNLIRRADLNRHCERSEAIQVYGWIWIASSLALLAMTEVLAAPVTSPRLP
jgi:hypothetical protein